MAHRLRLPVLATLASLIGCTVAAAQGTGEPAFVPSLPSTLAGVPGTWDLARDGGTRRCVLTLSAESGEAGRRVAFPAGCRKALPILNGIAGWLFTDGTVRLVDKNVRPVLPFTRRPDERSLVAQTETGDSYSLVPLQIAAMQPPGAETPTTGMPASTATSEPSPPSEGPAPGIYALDRYSDQDVCRLDLLEGEPARAPVRIRDGCRDSGLSVFDPVAWRYASGRLTLTAKRGHSVDLVPAGDGRWRRDPDIGTTFVLRRVEP